MRRRNENQEDLRFRLNWKESGYFWFVGIRATAMETERNADLSRSLLITHFLFLSLSHCFTLHSLLTHSLTLILSFILSLSLLPSSTPFLSPY